MSRGNLFSWQRPAKEEIAAVFAEFQTAPHVQDDVRDLAEEICLLRDEVSDLQRTLENRV